MDALLPYETFSSWLKARHGTRVYKVPLNPGLGCPNRDGTVSRAGCVFCDETESGHAAAAGGRLSIREQFDRQVATRRAIDRGPYRFYAYLQAGSGTHGDPETLRRLYAEVRSLPDLAGVSIAIRPDCVPDGILDLVARSFDGLDVWIELGVQTACDHTLAALRRNHTFADVIRALDRIRARGFYSCAHVILGLPGESVEDGRATARLLAEKTVDGVKLHALFVTRGSDLESEWRAGRFAPIDPDAYVRLVVDFLERTPPATVVQRLVGRGRPEVHLAPEWVLDPKRVRRAVLHEFDRRGTKQGSALDESSSAHPARPDDVT